MIEELNSNFISLVSLWLSFVILNPLIAWAFLEKRASWKKFWIIWFFTILVTGIFLTYLIVLPEQFLDLVGKAKFWVN